MDTLWFEVAILASNFVLGINLFGHFEEGIPKSRRVAKFFALTGLAVLISETAGRSWFFAFLGAGTLAVLVILGWWLPTHGINPWTAEPKEKYYRLRGWKMPPDQSHA